MTVQVDIKNLDVRVNGDQVLVLFGLLDIAIEHLMTVNPARLSAYEREKAESLYDELTEAVTLSSIQEDNHVCI